MAALAIIAPATFGNRRAMMRVRAFLRERYGALAEQRFRDDARRLSLGRWPVKLLRLAGPAPAQPIGALCSRCTEASRLAAIRIRYQVPGAAGGDQVGAEQRSGRGSIRDQP
jgi:hypothetical protein